MFEKFLPEVFFTIMNEYIASYLNNGHEIIAGIDEAGRGPLAGPVFAGVVILPVNHSITGLSDSKKISEKKREALYQKIIEVAVDFAVASADEKEIDEINILQATFLAMKRAVKKLRVKPDIILVDGNRAPMFDDTKTDCIVKGDSLVDTISAASILAKVSRDNFIKEVAKNFPEYGFEKHKGYGTKAHYEAIKRYGICPIHRKSFLKKLAF